MSIRIVQLTDLHLGSISDKSFQADAYKQFDAALAAAITVRPTAIVVTGDISLDAPDPVANDYLKSALDHIGLPYAVTSGNHDDSQQIAQLFYPELDLQREVYFSKRWGDENILFLDSSRGKFSDAQWTWLDNQLRHCQDRAIIFMHHPPVYTGASFMDSYHAFIEQEEFMACIHKYSFPVHVFCGHYHYEGSIIHKNLHLFVTPSTLFQMDNRMAEFSLAATTPGFRLINISPERITTSVHYVNS